MYGPSEDFHHNNVVEVVFQSHLSEWVHKLLMGCARLIARLWVFFFFLLSLPFSPFPLLSLWKMLLLPEGVVY